MRDLRRALRDLFPALLSLGCCAAYVPALPAPQAPQKLALLVGIDSYAPGTPASFPKLTGCVRDVGIVRDALKERFGFRAEDILVLTDEKATHEAIVRAFRDQLIDRAGPDTEVMFWFSGHGSRVPDKSGAAAAEMGGKDSTFVAYDSRAHGENGAFDMADDELRSLLAALTVKTSRVTVVTDSCHSGGATRGAPNPATPRYRGVDEGTRPVDRERLIATFWPKDVPLLDDSDAPMLEAPRYVHIGACGPLQLAQEIDAEGEDGKLQSHGALTFYLVQRLLEAQPHFSYRRLADDVAVQLSTHCPAQTVWSEGALSRELFGAHFELRPSGFRARVDPSAEKQGEVRIEAGTVHGLRPGSVIGLYDKSELIGRASVVHAYAVSSLARWIEPAPSLFPTGSLRAVEETRPAREEALPLYVPDPKVAALLGKSQRVSIAIENPSSAQYQLRAEPDGKLAFLAPGGLRIWKEADAGSRGTEAWLERLESEFREELRYLALVGLAVEHGSLEISGSFVAPTAEELEDFNKTPRYAGHCLDAGPRADAQGHGSASGAVYRAVGTRDGKNELSLAMLEIENRAPRPVHVSVLSASEDRLRNPIWPPEGEQDRVLEPGKRVRVPVNVVSNPDWRESRPMRDRYLVLATLEPADFTPFAREESTRGEAPAVHMPPILSLALEHAQTRGVHQANTDRSGWGLCVVDLLVDPPTKPLAKH
jgi:hypothetical protein